MSKGMWRLVNGDEARPGAAVSTAATVTEQAAMDSWDIKALKAAGELYLAVSDDQKTHLEGLEADPVAIWAKLKSIHLQQRPGARYNAWESFFSIQMRPDESLSSLMTRIDAGMVQVKNLRPSTYTLANLDEELVCMTMIRALPSSYSNFASSLQLLDKMTKDQLQNAFINEETLRSRPSTSSAPSDISVMAASAPSSSSVPLVCDFCSLQGHSMPTCHRFAASKSQATRDAQDRLQERKTNRKRGGKANTAQESFSATSPATPVSEFAGKASLRSPTASSSLQSPSDTLWTADTGATSHMTPHRHWLRNYSALRLPIRLANNLVIFSAGVGTLVFVPVVDGRSLRPVEFSRVLHVPDLGSNLLSVLHLTRHHQFHVHINATCMSFEQKGQTLFTAPIDASNTAYLAGTVIPPQSVLVSASSTLPLDESLWHRRFAHFHHAGLREGYL